MQGVVGGGGRAKIVILGSMLKEWGIEARKGAEIMSGVILSRGAGVNLAR